MKKIKNAKNNVLKNYLTFFIGHKNKFHKNMIKLDIVDVESGLPKAQDVIQQSLCKSILYKHIILLFYLIVINM